MLNPSVIAVCNAAAAKPPRDVEGEVAEAPEGVLDVLAEDGEEEHVAQRWLQLACMNIAVNQLIHQGSGARQVPSTAQG